MTCDPWDNYRAQHITTQPPAATMPDTSVTCACVGFVGSNHTCPSPVDPVHYPTLTAAATPAPRSWTWTRRHESGVDW